MDELIENVKSYLENMPKIELCPSREYRCVFIQIPIGTEEFIDNNHLNTNTAYVSACTQ